MNSNIYVGCTKDPLEFRWQKHLDKAFENKNLLQQAIIEYGKDNFSIEMIQVYNTKKDMLQGEIDWIAYLGTYKSSYGYNKTKGGEGGDTNGGKTFGYEWRLRLSKSMAGKGVKSRRKFSEDTEKEMCQKYVDEELSTYALERQFGCRRSTISTILKRNNIGIRKSNYTGHSNGKNIFSLEQEMEICKLYQEGNISRSELSRKFNCGKTTIRDILLRNNIKL